MPDRTSSARDALLARLSDAELIAGRRALDARDDLTGSERLTAAWLADEVHRRHPATEAILDRYFEADLNLSRGYGDLLADALVEVGAL